MISLQYIDPELVIALHKKVIFVNPRDLQIFKEIEIPAECKTLEDKEENAKKNQSQEPTIQHAKLSANGQYFAVSTIGQKALLLYQCRPEHAKLLSIRALARASSALTFSSDSKVLLVTDKTGDCYIYDCENSNIPAKLLFGHLSIVYDVIFSTDMNYIITCDRDDKIRVTSYPNCHEIHSYCLGHKEFVSGVQNLSSNAIVSISGDKTLCVWNFLDGIKIGQYEMSAPGIKFSLRQLNEKKWHVAVLVHQESESIFVYEIIQGNDNNFEITKQSSHSFDSMIATNLCYVNEDLYVTGTKNGQFALNVIGKETPNGWIEMVEDYFKDSPVKMEDISEWFKKRYDNVSDYLVRKKRRIEEKQCK